MTIFSHSGDLGDIIYSLPTIRAAGGGILKLFNFPGRTAHGMTEAKVERVKPLLECQPYIEKVEWTTEFCDSDLNGFRNHRAHGNLADMHLATHGFSWHERQTPWLSEIKRIRAPKVIISKTPRYENPNFNWRAVVEKYGKDIGFIGDPQEHGFFCEAYGEVAYTEARNLLAIAELIFSCSLFIGNPSLPAAIAEGLKHRMILVNCPGSNQHLAVFERWDCMIAWGNKIELPCLSIPKAYITNPTRFSYEQGT